MAPTINIFVAAPRMFDEASRTNNMVNSEIISRIRAECDYHDRITHVICSPLLDAISNCFYDGRQATFGRAPHAINNKVVLLPELQEISTQPSDTGGNYESIREMYGDDFSMAMMHPGWNDKSPETRYAPLPHKVESRAACARGYIRDLARACLDDDAHIVVITHRYFVHFLTQDFAGLTRIVPFSWRPGGTKSYQFVDLEGSDNEAALVEVEVEGKPNTAGDGGKTLPNFAKMSQNERVRLKAIAVEKVLDDDQFNFASPF
ncbi:hypothetical protein F4778DRAFT_783494 [Xylariomycetidae sp. FL2044]|nr:hypothetical protein F4778DRAFT_783494 [Xylariomycetidae sp. FL2044]